MRRHPRCHVLAGLLVSSLLLVGVASAPASAAVPCKYRNLTPSKSNLSKIRSAVSCLVNHERTRRGIARLKTSGALTTAARRHSSAMVSQRFFSHTGPDGSTPRSRCNAAGYPGVFIGENLAWGSGSLSTPRKIVSRWMASAGHRANILEPDYTDWGIGVAKGGPKGASGATYTTTFGRTQ